MSLADHLRELRYRLLFSLVVVVIGMVVCAFFYNALFNLLSTPLDSARVALAASNPELTVLTTLNDITEPLLLALKIIAVGGLVLTSPIWIYQVWAYVVPALLAKEKRLALAFLSAAIPLFLAGVALAYWVVPQAIVVLLGFTPTSTEVTNMLNLGNFLNLLIQLMLVFGVGFLVPVFVVALNMIGILPTSALKKSRRYVFFGCFVFAAAATPGGDPFSMVALAIPMALLFLAAEWICSVNDKRKARRGDVVPV
ncbi:twin-arginine translocase subunit TatC [Propioniciclava soli]|uniref:Sec-independent protein translocase protein TatC n=1 Tax=Propioniciclava soli TaxID=2775081 RepID=A0ABZ3CBH0_9ACTN|nr:twin-arginine translocase subunit TatC [Propioniciclava soli]